MHSRVNEQHVQNKKPRKPYAPPAGWGAYNDWSTAEIPRVLRLIRAVVDDTDLRTRGPARGGPCFPIRDLLKSLLVKVLFRVSYRRSIALLEVFEPALGIERRPHFNTLIKWMGRDEISARIAKLLRLAASMKEVEDSTLVIDATGFLRTRGSPWIFVREQRRRFLRRGYRKAHVACGLPSRTIVAMEVTPGTVHDHARFEDLVKTASAEESFATLVADSGYLSRAACAAAKAAGATPYIALKSNTRHRAHPRDAFEKMVTFWKHFPNRFHDRYRRRSQVESVFSEIKKLFGSQLATRRLVAQRNELLLVGLLYNLRVISRGWVRVE